ncbi:MarR family transcriptional regulator [Actinoplanes sp. NPDC051851]|uniref:MarR family winged helix-turn-helix transcriptional regulator n=1 Tax=Actinoplanes sp. NPDC051851 TaxID=3154753 RepID=UPI00342C1CF3
MRTDRIDDHVTTWADHFGVDPIQEAIIGRLSLLGRHLTRLRRHALDTGGLTHGAFKILLMLHRCEASPSELAERLGLTRGALSARLRPLEETGLITRSGEPGDRRRVRVRLTPAGLTAFDQHLDVEVRGEAHLLAGLSEPERRALADLLRKLVLATE